MLQGSIAFRAQIWLLTRGRILILWEASSGTSSLELGAILKLVRALQVRDHVSVLFDLRVGWQFSLFSRAGDFYIGAGCVLVAHGASGGD